MNNITIVKRNGKVVDFDATKIVKAIRRANGDVNVSDAISDGRIRLIAEEVEGFLRKRGTTSADEVQDMVETRLIELGSANIARAFISYRYKAMVEDYKSRTLHSKIKKFFSRLTEWIWK